VQDLLEDHLTEMQDAAKSLSRPAFRPSLRALALGQYIHADTCVRELLHGAGGTTQVVAARARAAAQQAQSSWTQQDEQLSSRLRQELMTEFPKEEDRLSPGAAEWLCERACQIVEEQRGIVEGGQQTGATKEPQRFSGSLSPNPSMRDTHLVWTESFLDERLVVQSGILDEVNVSSTSPRGVSVDTVVYTGSRPGSQRGSRPSSMIRAPDSGVKGDEQECVVQ